jgi:non-specific serine/threonine protein kinase
VRLFLERGRSASPSFRLDDANAAAVAEVCRKLDGVSLAIEMAAARLPVLTPNEIVRHLDERFAMLELSAVGRLTRHRTLTAAIEASDALLSDEQRSVFDRMSVFIGPFDLDAAAGVGLTGRDRPARVLAVVTSLVEASLLTPERDGGATRYRLMETLREYGLARLRRHGIEDEVRQAHAEHFLDLAAQAGADLWTPAFTTWMDRLGRRYTELQQALGWSLAHEARAVTLRAAPALHWFWYRRGDAPEAGRWSARMLQGDLEGVPADLLADVHNAATFATVVGTDYEAGVHHNDEAVRLSREAGSAQGLIISLWARANIALARGDVPSLRRDALEALALCDRIGDRWLRSGPLTALGFGALLDGSLEEARAWFEQALPLYRELRDRSSLVLMALAPLTDTAIRQHDLVAAERFASEAVELGTGTGWEAAGLVWYAAAMTERGDPEAAGAAASRALRVALDAGLENWFRLAVRELSRSAAGQGRLEEAARLLAASRRNMPAYGLDPNIYGPIEKQCRNALGADRSDSLAALGAAMSHDELLSLAGARA